MKKGDKTLGKRYADTIDIQLAIISETMLNGEMVTTTMVW